MEFLQHLLPEQEQLRLENWNLDTTTRHLNLTVSSTQTIASCPRCQRASQKVHSRYERTLRDIPCVSYSMTLLLQVRKFFCTNVACSQRIFTERLPQVTIPWARRTCRLAERLMAIGLAVGGAAGSRLSHKLGYGISRSTLLSLLARHALPQVGQVMTLGVDDFAFRKGQNYGTILVDLDKHRPIALLKDREAATLSEWLQQHPEVEVLSRDRSKAYQQGMNRGRPQAIQVADRFHLLKNLSEVLEQVFASQTQALKAVETAHLDAAGTIALVPPNSNPALMPRSEQRFQQRFARYEQLQNLRQQGMTVLEIAQQLGMGERTVYRYLHQPSFPEPQPRRERGQSVLNMYKTYVLKRWNEGQRESKQLFREIQQQGYRGSYPTLARYTQRLKQSEQQAVRTGTGQAKALRVVAPRQRPLTARRATWLVLKQPNNQTAEERALLAGMEQHLSLAPAITLAQGFIAIVRQRLPAQLDSWLEQANSSTWAAFQRFAQSLKEDYAAVKAGVTLAVSNGQVEGQVNRLKMLKRQMYGRAGFDLLQRRIVLAS